MGPRRIASPADDGGTIVVATSRRVSAVGTAEQSGRDAVVVVDVRTGRGGDTERGGLFHGGEILKAV